jgi:Ras-related protein Rab-6A
VSTDEGEAKAREHGAMFMETSAKAGFNIKVLTHILAFTSKSSPLLIDG